MKVHLLRGVAAVLPCLFVAGFLGIIDVLAYRPLAASVIWWVCSITVSIGLALLCDRALHDEWIWE